MVSPHSGSLLVLGQATGNTDSLDSPQPGLGGSHHLPPYSIFCVTPPHLHSNGIFFPGLPKWNPETEFGLPGLWAFIPSHPDLRSGRDLKQTCSSPRELFQQCVALHLHTPGSGRFPTFNGRESNCQFDSRSFFQP